uniref:Uncharacterized protein n=1 Tax=Octopus bimaculoides TaxID=37653 RepID=A0A0L8G7C7_OCTBM
MDIMIQLEDIKHLSCKKAAIIPPEMISIGCTFKIVGNTLMASLSLG